MQFKPAPLFPPQPANVRSYFDQSGCHIHGHPSSGGILIKRNAALVDMQLLSLPRLEASKRSHNAEEEDLFCEQLRRIGATWWEHETSFLAALWGEDLYYGGGPVQDEPHIRAVKEARAHRTVVFGWPADGSAGVWVLRPKDRVESRSLPTGFRRLDFALSMEERIEVMMRLGAEFFEDSSQLKELQEPWSIEVDDWYADVGFATQAISSLDDTTDGPSGSLAELQYRSAMQRVCIKLLIATIAALVFIFVVLSLNTFWTAPEPFSGTSMWSDL